MSINTEWVANDMIKDLRRHRDGVNGKKYHGVDHYSFYVEDPADPNVVVEVIVVKKTKDQLT